MKINLTEIQITPIKPRNGLLAFVSFILNDSFYMGGVSIHSRLNGEGYRLQYPMNTLINGLKINYFYPINQETAKSIEDQVITEFSKLIINTVKK